MDKGKYAISSWSVVPYTVHWSWRFMPHVCQRWKYRHTNRTHNFNMQARGSRHQDCMAHCWCSSNHGCSFLHSKVIRHRCTHHTDVLCPHQQYKGNDGCGETPDRTTNGTSMLLRWQMTLVQRYRVCHALPGVHAFTGHDYTAVMVRRGKINDIISKS